jgi:hypothetical protein
MYSLGTWFVSGICVWIPHIKEKLMIIIIIIIITLSYDRSIASPRTDFPRSAIYCFILQFLVSCRFCRYSVAAYVFFFVFSSLLSFLQ